MILDYLLSVLLISQSNMEHGGIAARVPFSIKITM